MLTLFTDQQVVVDNLRGSYRSGKRAPLLVAPCGFGKTVVFSYITDGARRLGKRVLIMAHRVELIDQICKSLTQFDVPHGVIASGYPIERGYTVYVASVFTLVRRLDFFIPDLLVCDEAHHMVASTTWGKVAAAYPQARRLGVSATPCRLSGEGLGDLFDDLVLGPTTSELIDLGRLSPLRVFAPPWVDTSGLHTRGGDFVKSEMELLFNKPTVTGNAVSHYTQHAAGKQAVVFCTSVEHARQVAAQFRDAGYASTCVDGGLAPDVRNLIIREFRDGKLKVLTSCDLVSEGFDVPCVEVGISLRPTQSLSLWIQQCGRILRRHPGKDAAILLDHAGNTLRHGLPTDPREWTLAGIEKQPLHDKPAPSVRVCPACYCAQESKYRQCRNCGHTFKVEARKVRQKDGKLEELTPEKLAARRARQEVGMSQSLEALINLGRMRGYKSPENWARHVWEGRQMKRRVAND